MEKLLTDKKKKEIKFKKKHRNISKTNTFHNAISLESKRKNKTNV